MTKTSSASNAATSSLPAVRLENLPKLVIQAYCTAYENHEVETRSRPDAFPSVLQLKRTTQTKEHLDANVKTKVGIVFMGSIFHQHLFTDDQQTAETCPKCGHKEALSQERQVCRHKK